MATKTIQTKEQRDQILDQMIEENDYFGLQQREGWDTMSMTVQRNHPHCFDALLVRLTTSDLAGIDTPIKVVSRVGITGIIELLYDFDRAELEGILGGKQRPIFLQLVANFIASYVDTNPLGGHQYDDQGRMKIVPINFVKFDKMMNYVIDHMLAMENE